MSKMTTEKHLVQALLNDGTMSKALFEEELLDETEKSAFDLSVSLFLTINKEIIRDQPIGRIICKDSDT